MALAYQPRDETLGRYRLFARLALGGMAELYVARLIGAARVEKLVAIKRMLPHLVEDPQFVAMFENEGRIAARLGHPNVCQTYELGEADGQLFLVMEFLRGLPWSEVVTALPQDEHLRSRFIVGVMTQACEGLHYAHTLIDADGQLTPVVHRDVSPANLMITTDGVVKVLDFGVSKVMTEGPATRTGMIKGKLPYMAPEQIRGEVVDGRADVFSLGVVLWEALAGLRLFDRPSDFQIWKAVTEEPIPRLPTTPITAALEAVVLRALSRDRDHRHPDARSFADALQAGLAPFATPMGHAEIRQALATWLAPNLAREARDLAAAINQHRDGDLEAARLGNREPSDQTTVDLVERHAPVAQRGRGAAAPSIDFSVPGAWHALDRALGDRDDVEDVTEDDPGPSHLVLNQQAKAAARTRVAPAAVRTSSPPGSIIVASPDGDEELTRAHTPTPRPHRAEPAAQSANAASLIEPTPESLAPTQPRNRPTFAGPSPIPAPRLPPLASPSPVRARLEPTERANDVAGIRRWWLPLLLVSIAIGVAAAIGLSDRRPAPAVVPLAAPGPQR